MNDSLQFWLALLFGIATYLAIAVAVRGFVRDVSREHSGQVTQGILLAGFDAVLFSPGIFVVGNHGAAFLPAPAWTMLLWDAEKMVLLGIASISLTWVLLLAVRTFQLKARRFKC